MRRQVATLFAISIASSARADDWAQPIVTLQQSLAALGISLGGGVTGFAQGLASGDGEHGVPFGGKADALLGLDGGKLGLWPGLSVSAHFEQNFGQSANELGAGAILPVNTALAFPTIGGSTTDLSLIVTQKFGDAVSISLGKFNVLDVAARTPLMGGGGETTFWNIGLAAPVSGVTPLALCVDRSQRSGLRPRLGAQLRATAETAGFGEDHALQSTCNRPVTPAPRCFVQPPSGPASASPSCAGVHLSARSINRKLRGGEWRPGEDLNL